MLENSFFSFAASFYGYVKFQYLRRRERMSYGNYYFPYTDELNNKRVYILANGPSLKDEIKCLLSSDSFGASAKCVVNYFANSEYFTHIKPEYYVLADYAFWGETISDKVKNLVHVLNTDVTWPMTLFIVNKGVDKVRSLINNNKIKIVPVTTLLFYGFESHKYLYYKQGKAVPSFVNVTIMAEYVLLNRGCKDIHLYGVDHTFFNGLAVDDENYACIIDEHFYGKEVRRLPKPDGGYFTMAEWIMDKYLTFKEHENLRGYADYLEAKVVNCTRCSLIDAYERLKIVD